jgi:predicted 3-demethylubiquinone-9 3-methyltransferase (glyoxalase superfamily)
MAKVTMKKITPFLWFDDKAHEAARFYCSVFKNSKLGEVSRWAEGGPVKKGAVKSVTFSLEGLTLFALNGGPHFKFTPAVSLFVLCKTQKEVDDYWRKLLKGGGQESQCGWLSDRYGLSWQIIPETLMKLLDSKDSKKAGRVQQAMMGMVKLDIEGLKAAAAARD